MMDIELQIFFWTSIIPPHYLLFIWLLKVLLVLGHSKNGSANNTRVIGFLSVLRVFLVFLPVLALTFRKNKCFLTNLCLEASSICSG